MGYRITYENGMIHKENIRQHRISWKWWGAGILAAAVAVTLMVPQGRLWIRDLFLPGDEEITASALESMVADLRAGEPLGEAVEAFCREIIAGGV